MAKLTLAALAAATASNVGYTYATEKDAKHLVDAGHAEVGVVNPENPKEFAIRATEAGMTEAAKANASAASTAPTAPFQFITGAPLAREHKRSGRTTKYPFDDFPAPTFDANGTLISSAKIFIPATNDMPEPHKSLSSTVSAANRRYAEITGKKPGKNKKGEEIQKNVYDFKRKFEIVAGEHDGIKGAWIERVK